MARCEQGYLCEVCGRDVGEITESDLYLRYVLGEVPPEQLHLLPERHIRCNPALAQVCESNGYVLESRVLTDIKDLIETFASNDGKIDEKEFNDAVTTCKKKMQGKKNDVQVKRMVLEIIEENSYKVKTGMFSNWYARVKKECGMA